MRPSVLALRRNVREDVLVSHPVSAWTYTSLFVARTARHIPTDARPSVLTLRWPMRACVPLTGNRSVLRSTSQSAARMDRLTLTAARQVWPTLSLDVKESAPAWRTASVQTTPRTSITQCAGRMEGPTLTDAELSAPTPKWLAGMLVQNVLETSVMIRMRKGLLSPYLFKSNIYFQVDQQEEQVLILSSMTLSRTTVSASLSTLSPEKPSSITWKLLRYKVSPKVNDCNDFTNSAKVLI